MPSIHAGLLGNGGGAPWLSVDGGVGGSVGGKCTAPLYAWYGGGLSVGGRGSGSGGGVDGGGSGDGSGSSGTKVVVGEAERQ